MRFVPVIGLEVHAELLTRTKMFCACPVVDSSQALPNSSVCPVCLGLPGALPVTNKKAVELGLRAALALDCTPLPVSIFARKNYFYPDLPKGYQISQYETPLAVNGRLEIETGMGKKVIRIRRVHLEEDTGKLTHINQAGNLYSLVDLNRAGIPLLEIVTEPDMHNVQEARAYAVALRQLLRHIGVNSGDMENGALRFEANISVMPEDNQVLGIRTEIKNLNSFRAMENALDYEIKRQVSIIEHGGQVLQETVGWKEADGVTFSQRGKEEAHDYRYFPEPDLPPLAVATDWIERIRQEMPELPEQKRERYANEYQIPEKYIAILLQDLDMATFFEQVVNLGGTPQDTAKWITGVLAGEVNSRGLDWDQLPFVPGYFAELIEMTRGGEVNLSTAKSILKEMFSRGYQPKTILAERGYEQINDLGVVTTSVQAVLQENPKEVANYLAGKENLAQWFFGQVMVKTHNQASPHMVKNELLKQLDQLKKSQSSD